VSDQLERLKSALADRYAVEREIGSGGMATVYLAEDLKHHRQVAVKVLRPDLAAALGSERFLREIEIAARLDHPHILPLYDSGEAQGFLYYVMPFVEGESLRDRLDREKQLAIDVALQIAREVADGLSYAHSRDVVHRDIKPENILLAGGHARIADFGIARAVTEAGGGRLTETGLALGTPTYMSPEQAGGDRDLDGRSDLYSLGCVLYEMLAGQPPFTGATIESVVHQHLTVEPPSVTTLRPAVPPQVTAALARVLAKTPADRFSPAAQFAEALRDVGGTGAPGLAAAPRPSDALWTRPLLAGAAFSLGAVALLALIFLLVLQLGLPTWVFASAVGLLVVGLPIVVATSTVERRRIVGTTGGAGAADSWLTWRRALIAGALGFGVLAVVTVGYSGMRALGIGPAGSLIASGAIAERERVILADFENRTTDSAHGPTVTELMRIGLSQSQAISIVDPSQVGRILLLMQRDPAHGVDAAVAMEAAQREGINAVITGEIVAVGSGYSISARLVSTGGDVLAALQETAGSEDELVGAVDRLAAGLRERVGESLRSIRRREPLERVTTRSMRALRLFSQGLRASNLGDDPRAMQLLEEAIALDTTFAMAYRKLAIVLQNHAERRSRAVEAATKAYQYRDALTERERYLVTAAYHSVVTRNRDQIMSAYSTVLDLYPYETIALNNLGVVYSNLREFERAAALYARALTVDSTSSLHYRNLSETLERVGNPDSAASIVERFARRMPGNPEVAITRILGAALRKDYDAAEQLGYALMDEQRGRVFWEAIAYMWLGNLSALRGQMNRAQREWDRSLVLTAERDLSGRYLVRAAQRAILERLLLDDSVGTRRVLGDALERYPLESLAPLDRPYGSLANAFAAAGDPARGRELIAEFDATPEADHSRDAERARHGALGIAALAEGRPEEAIDEFWQWDDGNACYTCAYPWLARAYDQMGESDSALALYERFVEIPSSSVGNDAGHLAQAYVRVGELYEQRGDRERAIDYYQRFVDLWKNADPELQQQVEEVRGRIVRLAGEPRG
jgi:tetratricopeptide (TPR) repeat protein